MADTAPPVCARCGYDRLRYTDGDKTHIVLPFAVPADAPLDERSIEKYVIQFSAIVADALREHRKRRGDKESPIILLS